MVMTLIRGFMSITEDITVILTVSACLWRTRPIATRRALRSYLIDGLPQSDTLRLHDRSTLGDALDFEE